MSTVRPRVEALEAREVPAVFLTDDGRLTIEAEANQSVYATLRDYGDLTCVTFQAEGVWRAFYFNSADVKEVLTVGFDADDTFTVWQR